MLTPADPGQKGVVTARPGASIPVLFLDLDGTVRHHRADPTAFINDPTDIAVYPEALTMMRRWKSGGGRIIGVSNQGGVALGYMSMSACLAGMMTTQALCGDMFDQLKFCPHHPAARDVMMGPCWCRKPSPGLLIIAAEHLAQITREVYLPQLALMVGDRPEDQQAAACINVDFQDAESWRAQAAQDPPAVPS